MMTFSEIDELIDSGGALPALNEFIRFATVLSVGIRTGQMQEMPGTQATIIAAVALQKLMHTTDGRKLLGIRASNKVYNEKELSFQSPQYEIARRLGCGEITREQALIELSAVYAKAQTYPDKKRSTEYWAASKARQTTLGAIWNLYCGPVAGMALMTAYPKRSRIY